MIYLNQSKKDKRERIFENKVLYYTKIFRHSLWPFLKREVLWGLKQSLCIFHRFLDMIEKCPGYGFMGWLWNQKFENNEYIWMMSFHRTKISIRNLTSFDLLFFNSITWKTLFEKIDESGSSRILKKTIKFGTWNHLNTIFLFSGETLNLVIIQNAANSVQVAVTWESKVVNYSRRYFLRKALLRISLTSINKSLIRRYDESPFFISFFFNFSNVKISCDDFSGPKFDYCVGRAFIDIFCGRALKLHFNMIRSA